MNATISTLINLPVTVLPVHHGGATANGPVSYLLGGILALLLLGYLIYSLLRPEKF